MWLAAITLLTSVTLVSGVYADHTKENNGEAAPSGQETREISPGSNAEASESSDADEEMMDGDLDNQPLADEDDTTFVYEDEMDDYDED